MLLPPHERNTHARYLFILAYAELDKYIAQHLLILTTSSCTRGTYEKYREAQMGVNESRPLL